MDFEEAWREAVQEEEDEKENKRIKLQRHSSQFSRYNDEKNITTSLASVEPNDPYDEFSDDDLLQSVPYANDAAPVLPAAASGMPLSLLSTVNAASSVEPRQACTFLNTHASSPLSARLAANTTRSSAAYKNKPTAPSHGVLSFPPTKLPSFMLRGDDGRVCWVTASNRTGPTASMHKRKDSGTSRKRARAPAVIEIIDDDDEKNCMLNRETEVVDVDSSTTTSSVSGGADGGSDAGDDLPMDDIDDASSSSSSASSTSDVGAQRHSTPGNFLGDGASVKDMLREIYADEAKRQEERRKKEGEKQEKGTDDAQDEEDNRMHCDEDRAARDRFLTPTRAVSSSSPAAQNATPRSTRLSHTASSNSSSGELWVTKYSPKLFRDVLSDESISLRLLQWLKSWDAYVFPEEAAASGGSAAAVGGLKHHSIGTTSSTTSHKSAMRSKDGLTATGPTSAATSPPEERIAVLTGPPGVGKTTLVHVLAAHCGYEVIEINASVERTASRLEALIKTAVSASGPAPGGRMQRPSSSSSDVQRTRAATRAEDGDVAANDGGNATSLVQHLLRPKCLVIDEMDGIASSSVAAYLMQLPLHRPVFCLCNDFYVPSLRPLQQRCSHVYHLPPIRPQRLLARLEEIARREHATALDQMALSELITTSGGDVRSCLNTMQFISSVVSQQQQQHQQSERQGDVEAAPPRHIVIELIRRMEGKDTRPALKESWQLLFTRPERNKAVQLLRQDCGVDYEGLVEAAVAQHHRQHIVEMRRRQERERAIGRPAHTVADGDDGSTRRCDNFLHDGARPQPQQQAEVALGFRVDPGYLYAAHRLARCSDTAGLIDGLQENYLDRAYTDYSFSRTSGCADGFSRQDVVTAASFQHPETLMDTAERLNQVAALTCYVHCSTAARGGRIEFPREQATLRRLRSESQHVGQQFRAGCRPHIAAFLGGEEVTSTDMAPMLLRSLFDRSLRLPAHAITSFSGLPQADQQLLHASVARHVEYGLNYEKDRQYVPPSFGGGGYAGPFSTSSSDDEVPWRLTPALDKLLAGVVRPMEKSLLGRRGASFFQRSRYGDRSGGVNININSSSAGAHGPSSFVKAAGGGIGSSSTTGRPSLSSVLMPLKNEIRQILVGEIRQYEILQTVGSLNKKQQQQQQQQQQDAAANKGAPAQSNEAAGEKAAAVAAAVKTGALQEKRQNNNNNDSRSCTNAATSNAAAGGSPGLTDTSAKIASAADLTAKAEDDDDMPGLKKARQEETAGAKMSARTAVRRDFFGRPIPDPLAGDSRANRTPNSTTPASRFLSSPSTSASPSPTGSSAAGGGGGSGAFPRSQPPHVPSTHACVRYIYQDGSTNAVKMPAVLADF